MLCRSTVWFCWFQWKVYTFYYKIQKCWTGWTTMGSKNVTGRKAGGGTVLVNYLSEEKHVS